MSETDVIIVGGGLNGSALALALAGAGLRAALVDRLPAEAHRRTNFDGRAYALAQASGRLLQALGLWERLDAQAEPIREIRVTDGRIGEPPSPFLMEFSAAEIEEGPLGWMLEDRHLRPVLRDAVAAEPRIQAVDGAEAAGLARNAAGASVTLADGRRLTGRLVVAADGAGSPTARRAGIGYLGWEYGQRALVCAIAHERPHGGTAHQLFTPSGPLALLPLRENRSAVVWTEREALARRIAGLDDDAYLDELRPRVGDFLGRIELAGARHDYPLALSLARRMAGERLALIGDAAHRVHPLAGQGLNAGLKDVATLAEVLVEARRRGEDIGRADVLARYARWRRFDVAGLAAATDGFHRLFGSDNALVRMARDIGLGLVNATPPLRRAFIREAAGLTGELPRLLQGRAI